MNRWIRVLVLRLLVLPTLCALVVGVGLRYWFGIQDPQAPIPSPTMPSPNGFDLLRTAGEKVRADHDTISELSNRRSAYGEWEPKDKQGKPLSAEGRKQLLAERQVKIAALIRRQADTVTQTRKALEMTCRMPPLRSINDPAPYYADFRDLARLMVLEGEDAKAKGATPDQVARKYLDAIRLGEKVSQGGPLIGHLVCIAITAIGQHALAPLATEVSPTMARTVIKTLKRCQQGRRTFAETMTEEKYTVQASILELYRYPERFSNQKSESLFEDEPSPWTLRFSLTYIIWSKRTMFDNVSRNMDRTIEQAKQPYRADTPELKLDDDPISRAVFPAFSQARFKDVLIQTQDELLIARFAAEAYRSEHGGHPKTVKELTHAGYPLPIDPFADGKPLAYEYGSDACGSYCNWHSVGPDRKDDGGKPCENPTVQGQGKEKFKMSPDSKGDIVPSVNVFQ